MDPSPLGWHALSFAGNKSNSGNLNLAFYLFFSFNWCSKLDNLPGTKGLTSSDFDIHFCLEMSTLVLYSLFGSSSCWLTVECLISPGDKSCHQVCLHGLGLFCPNFFPSTTSLFLKSQHVLQGRQSWAWS